MEHYEAEKKEGKLKPLSVKITTLNKELKGVDCFSYEEDDMVNVPNLREVRNRSSNMSLERTTTTKGEATRMWRESYEERSDEITKDH